MAREMRQFANASMTAGKIKLKLKTGVTTYQVIGWSVLAGKNVELYAEDQRRTRPVLVCPVEAVDTMTIDLLT